MTEPLAMSGGLIYVDLILNLTLLVALTILSGFLDRRFKRMAWPGALAQGALFGLCAVIGMMRPLILGPGLIFDGRSVMVSLCALFFGPWAALVAIVPPVFYRISLGGAGMAMGVMVILESALIGYAARILLKPQLNPPSPSRLYALGAAVHLVMLALMFTLPKEAGLETFRRVGLTVIIAYPLATILAGSILSDHLRAERGVAALRESDERFKLSMEATSDGLWDLDLDSDVSYFNPAYYAILGYETGDFPATGSAWRSRVHPDDLAAAMRANIDCIEGRTDTIDIEYRMKARDGSWRWIRARGKGVQRDAAGKAGRLVGTHVDISSRKAAEEELRRGLEEKEVLLRELHHRVKNNLNVISSLLSLQSSAIRTPEQAMAALLNSKDRVLAMALVHEELYRSNDFSRVNMARYLDDLVRPLLGAYASGDSVAVDIRADEVSLSLNDSIPCGLILNELITNAFKHAFPGGACGRIDVAFSEGESGLLELSVRDTGAGLPLSWEEKARDSLGLTLVRLLVQQLDGTLDIRSDGGTAFRIRFQRKVAV